MSYKSPTHQVQLRDESVDVEISSQIRSSSPVLPYFDNVSNKRSYYNDVLEEIDENQLNSALINKRMKTKPCEENLDLIDSDRTKVNGCNGDITINGINSYIQPQTIKNDIKCINDNLCYTKISDCGDNLKNGNSEDIYNGNSNVPYSNGFRMDSEVNGDLNSIQDGEGCLLNGKDIEISSNLNDFSDFHQRRPSFLDESDDDDNYLDSSGTEEVLNCIEDGRYLEDGDSCEDDDQSVISSITVGSTCSLRSAASETMSSIYMNENGVASNEDGSLLYGTLASSTPLNVLSCSLFPHVPPTMNFCKYDETTEPLPEDVSKLLKWKFTTITPMIVRKTITNSGFKIIKKTVTWCGTWGKHMKSPCFKVIKDYQKINHFPGSFQIGRKDKLWKNFSKFQTKFGKNEFGFIPKTFVLPEDMTALKTAFTKEGPKKKWIVKPPASARGTGIQVVDKWSQMPQDTPVVVQRYISRPYLINDTKFDIRLYVLVTSFHPLRIFLYEDGLVRFASVPYQAGSKTLGDRFMHLTNYSVNKSSSSYTHNDDAGHCHGHKWTLKTLWGYLKAQEVDTGALWSRIVDIVIKTMLSGENEIVLRSKKFSKNIYNCFELFGFDVILDEKLNPWLLEVNISPSLHSASSLDHSVKGPLITDLLNLVGYHIPDKLSQERQMELLSELELNHKISGLCLDRRIYTRLLTIEEQLKHVKINALSRNEWLKEVLETLQPNDVRQLIIAEDQRNRAGRFACVFPTAETYNYFGFMSKVRYYNRLMDAWESAYENCRDKGIELLGDLCRKGTHLKVTNRFKLPKTACLPPVDNSLTSIILPSDRETTPSPPKEPLDGLFPAPKDFGGSCSSSKVDVVQGRATTACNGGDEISRDTRNDSIEISSDACNGGNEISRGTCNGGNEISSVDCNGGNEICSGPRNGSNEISSDPCNGASEGSSGVCNGASEISNDVCNNGNEISSGACNGIETSGGTCNDGNEMSNGTLSETTEEVREQSKGHPSTIETAVEEKTSEAVTCKKSSNNCS